ncbi:hypothetical protein BDV96DRAFT_563647 [Lophiotrema nucula]|uniref:Uncharacterized protein n=1 Tax=Lophiotrema nucula TaxID=690887 RepID=A0A6A5ZSA8_9PLEO|nr:hypothetical protein BDV96DRAFT_563647 [Lophiotrema nucula]
MHCRQPALANIPSLGASFLSLAIGFPSLSSLTSFFSASPFTAFSLPFSAAVGFSFSFAMAITNRSWLR